MDGADRQDAEPDPVFDVPPGAFLNQLEPFEKVLVELKDTLYEGSWDRVLSDLRARLDGQPYVYKLGQTISRDIAAIEKLRAYERRHGVSLSELLKKN